MKQLVQPKRIALAAVGALVAALVPAVSAAAVATTTQGAVSPAAVTRPHQAPVTAACPAAATGAMHCMALIRTDIHGGKGIRGPRAASRADSTLPAGYGPADLRSAYKLPATGGANQTVGIIDAGDDPNAEADLAVYRSTYGLPPCTTASGCFSKVNQRGTTDSYPPDQGWSGEIALDLDMVSAACSSCRIVLVEADDASFENLGASVNTAVALGATEVSNSYGGTEQNGMQSVQADYAHPGVAILASSGDSGYGIPSFPAVFPSVIAAGGTTLNSAPGTARGWSETAWSGAGSGCSAWIDKPAWQQDSNCPGRITADVSADADPQTGLALYDTDIYGGWIEAGGTSASSPFLAGVIALAGNPGAFPDASFFYTHAGSLNDVVGGNNSGSFDCGGDYQCNAVPGYDGPTGNGTPNGIGAF